MLFTFSWLKYFIIRCKLKYENQLLFKNKI